MYTPQEITQRIAQYLKQNTSKMEGSFSMDNIQAVSQELAMMYHMTVLPIDDKYFLDTASTEFLDRRALDFNEVRNPAVQAQGIVIFKGAKGTVIPEKTGVQSDTLTFETIKESVIGDDGTVSVPVICTVAGSIGNINAKEIKNIRAIDGLSGIEASNPSPFVGGVDEETDEAFRSRILEKIRRPYTSGNCNDYVRWAKQVSGVGNAICVPCWAGNGTVKVIVLSSTGGIPDDAIINNVVDHIEDNRPIGATVTVVKAIPKGISIVAEIKLVKGYSNVDVKQLFIQYLQEYLTDKAFGTDKSISYFKISDLLYNVTGVYDVLGYTINGSRQSVTAIPEEFFEISEVTINVIA